LIEIGPRRARMYIEVQGLAEHETVQIDFTIGSRDEPLRVQGDVSRQ
jgi:hypothetical protein